MAAKSNDHTLSSPPATPWRVGFGRADITLYEHGMLMMGWGMPYNKALGVAVPLHARACIIESTQSSSRFAFVVLDTMMITQGLHLAVLDSLAEPAGARPAIAEHELILAATHTHSGPSGFAHHFWTNLSAPGFSPKVFDGLVAGVVAAVRAAAEDLNPATLAVSQTTVPLSDGVAFNRSWFAYNKNRDVTPVSKARRDEATDRAMTVLSARDASGRLRGVLQWFATHGTTVHASNTQIHPDYKGLAALSLEAAGLGVVIAQECCGDVSPNYRWDKRRKHNIGKHDDDFASAQHVADSQVRHLRSVAPLDASPDEIPLTGPFTRAVRWVDFSRAAVAPKFSVDGLPQLTNPALLGLSMAEGTAEGPGPLRRVRGLNRALSVAARRLRGDPKVPFIDFARGRDGQLLNFVPLTRTPALDPLLKWVRAALNAGGIHAGSWIPQVLPINLIRIGHFAIVGVPFETTTVAGRRLRATVRDALPGVKNVVITTYASAYVGYLTTYEEYQVQHYEAGYNVFGPHSLDALRTELTLLCSQLESSPREGPPHAPIDTSTLEKIRFEGPTDGRRWL